MEEKHSPDQERKMNKKQGRGKDSVFRIMLRNQVRLIDIADKKASMLIGINSVILSLIIGTISSRFMYGVGLEGGFFKEKIYALPILIIVLTSLISAVFSIIAVKPRIYRAKKEKGTGSEEEEGKLFFENYYYKPQKDFLNEFNAFLEDNEEIYEQFTIEMYYQGKVLHRKYKLIAISYLIFMFGFIAAVLAFIFIWLL